MQNRKFSKPLVGYQINRQLSGRIPPLQVKRAFGEHRNEPNSPGTIRRQRKKAQFQSVPAVAEAAVRVLRESGMIKHAAVEPKPTEGTLG